MDSEDFSGFGEDGGEDSGDYGGDDEADGGDSIFDNRLRVVLWKPGEDWESFASLLLHIFTAA